MQVLFTVVVILLLALIQDCSPFAVFILLKRRSLLSPLRSTTSDELIHELNALKNGVLYPAAATKDSDPQSVVKALLDAEKLTRKINKSLPDAVNDLRPRLCADWRLIFTTGTLKTQKKVGNINYFPLKAVQSFTMDGGISNSIYAFGLPLIKFKGGYELVAVGDSSVRVEFDFDIVRLFDLVDVGLGGSALEVGERTGLGSGDGVKKEVSWYSPLLPHSPPCPLFLIFLSQEGKKKAFFNWGIADDQIATARGGGGGIALWKKIEEGISA